MSRALDKVAWTWVVVACLSLGLAPFVPQPHFFEKLLMLTSGRLTHLVDTFDFILHGAPWFFLFAKVSRYLWRRFHSAHS
jgi:hypothetical protein